METTIGLGVIISLVGCFVGLAGWLSGRDKRIMSDSEWRGVINTKLDIIAGIKCDVDALEKTVQEHGSRLSAMETEVTNVYHRLNELRGKEGK